MIKPYFKIFLLMLFMGAHCLSAMVPWPWIVSAANILSAGAAYKIAVDPFINKTTSGYRVDLKDLRHATPEERKLFLARYPSMHDTNIYMSDELGRCGFSGMTFSSQNAIVIANGEGLATVLKALNTDPKVYKEGSFELIMHNINHARANGVINDYLVVFDHEMGHIIDNASAKEKLLGTTVPVATAGTLSYLGHKLLGPIKKSRIPLTRCLMRIPIASALSVGCLCMQYTHGRYAECIADENVRPSLIPKMIDDLYRSPSSYKAPEEAFPTLVPLLKKHAPFTLPHVNKFCEKFLVTHDRDNRINRLQKRYDLYTQQQLEAQRPFDYKAALKKPIKAPASHEWEYMDGHGIQVWQEIFEAEKQGLCKVERQSKWIDALKSATQKLSQEHAC